MGDRNKRGEQATLEIASRKTRQQEINTTERSDNLISERHVTGIPQQQKSAAAAARSGNGTTWNRSGTTN